MDLYNYIMEYPFIDHAEKENNKFKDKKYKKFAKEFWVNPGASISKLKNKHGISSSIAFHTILKQNITPEYAKFLTDCWSSIISIDNIVEKYGINVDKIEQLIFPIPFFNENYMCEHCLENSTFNIERNVKTNKYAIFCTKCSRYIKKFITKEELLIEKEKREKAKVEFENTISDIEDKIKEIRCPKCRSEMNLQIDYMNFSYLIECNKCEKIYDNFTNLVTDFEKYKQRAALMINIREKEEELIKNFLDKKSVSEIRVGIENIITQEECKETLEYFNNIKCNNENEIFNELLKNIKRLSRLGKILLINICELFHILSYDNINWTKKGDSNFDINTICLTLTEPLVHFLLNETRILVVRKTLRELIKNNLICCCEEKNTINIHPILLEHVDSIKNLLKPQNIDKEISYLIFGRQNYTCYHCGETGRPLKIAYLNVEKNINDLSSLIGICDLCYYDITQDEILIDGMITGIDETDIEEPICWKFVTYYYPDFIGNEKAYKENRKLMKEFKEDNIIKAYAITVNKFKKLDERGGFFKYAQAILNNSYGKVEVWGDIMESFNVEEWISKIGK